MFLPLGDDLDKKSLPAVGCFLVGVNVLAFVYEMRLMAQSPSGAIIIAFIKDWGLVPATLEHRYITLITSMFLHGDLSHLIGNMLMLWAFVGTLEKALGWGKFLLLYLAWGIIAGLTHAAMNWGSPMPMIGASGAISGMIGAYFVAFGALTNIHTLVWFIKPRRVNIPAGAFVFLWVASQLLEMEAAQSAGQQGGIAWWAHIGGFLAGAITMLAFSREVKSKLALSREGTVVFEQQPAAAALAVAEHPADCACIYCGQSLSEENAMHETLFRCPNPRCGRLVYLQ